jgi:hypothetical protein
MTKAVRIENADSSNYKVLVQTWDKAGEGLPDTLVSEQALNNPCDMTDINTYIHKGRYLVVKEAD